jgi:NAD(P)-dependent dehydrogenase (short-subunit alcohol dehydrogenase family)
MKRLDGKVAVITGGAGGIGLAAGALFAAEGANVVLMDLSADTLEAARDKIAGDASNPAGEVSTFAGDVTVAADNVAVMDFATQRYGGVDIFLANAGIEGDVTPLRDYDEAMFERVMAVNVKGVFLGLKAAIPALEARGGGSIVITSSVAGVRSTPRICAYGTSKHAVIGLMRAAAVECAPLNIRVNTVNPSPVETRMMRSLEEGIAPGEAETAKERLTQGIPLQRYAEPVDIARVMLFLASDDSAWVTGSVQMADGGNTA